MFGFRRWVQGICLGVAVVATYAQAQADGEYTLGAGDEVRVTVYGQPELTADGQVSAAGMVVVPLLGNLSIAGKSSAEAAYLIGYLSLHAPDKSGVERARVILKYRTIYHYPGRAHHCNPIAGHQRIRVLHAVNQTRDTNVD